MVSQSMPLRTHALVVAQRYSCAYCGERFLRAWQVTFDHVVPRSRGGSNGITNGLAACAPCNLKKADRMPTPEELVLCKKVSSIAMDLLDLWKTEGEPKYEFDMDIEVHRPVHKQRQKNRTGVDKSTFVSQFDREVIRQTKLEQLDKRWPVPTKKQRKAEHAERRARNMQRAQESKSWPYNSLPGGD